MLSPSRKAQWERLAEFLDGRPPVGISEIIAAGYRNIFYPMNQTRRERQEVGILEYVSKNRWTLNHNWQERLERVEVSERD